VLKQQDPNKKFVIEGHTDAVGSEESNMQLSERRATSVQLFLIEHGVPADRIVAIGKGESQPLTSNDTPENRANNRRVEIVIQ
jgi:OmpA-OmpF porin, OOP family